MAEVRRAPGIAAEDVFATVRVHADRVHDLARRLGCTPAAALEVVEASALDLVESVSQRRSMANPVGWWFGRARSLASRAAGGDPDLPVGGGLLAVDADQVRLAEALEVLAERDLVPILLRDTYALDAEAVGAALGSDADGALSAVARGRLAFLRAAGLEVPDTGVHPLDLPALARLGESDRVAAADATAHRHAQSCPTCRAVWVAQQEAHRMLSGLAVVAIPESERPAILLRVDASARAALPSRADLALAAARTAAPPAPLFLPLVALVGLLVAVALGAGVGVLLSRASAGGTAGAAGGPATPPPLVTAPVPTPLAVPPPPSPVPPTTRVFTVAPPTPSPSPSPTPSASATPAGPVLQVSPASGPNGARLRVTGTGWRPGTFVTLDYLDPSGQPTGSRALAPVDATGAFRTTLTARDPSGQPGPHTVSASDGISTAEATYDVTG